MITNQLPEFIQNILLFGQATKEKIAVSPGDQVTVLCLTIACSLFAKVSSSHSLPIRLPMQLITHAGGIYCVYQIINKEIANSQKTDENNSSNHKLMLIRLLTLRLIIQTYYTPWLNTLLTNLPFSLSLIAFIKYQTDLISFLWIFAILFQAISLGIPATLVFGSSAYYLYDKMERSSVIIEPNVPKAALIYYTFAI
ncbi:MAG: hypothetical protein VXZ72_01845 [Chlamydiota bacterium]|nr:hypothetical protein [Chlamydiota bacterium]